MDTRSARSGVGLPRRCFRNKYGVGHQRDIRSLYAASLTILCLKRRSSGVALPTTCIVAPGPTMASCSSKQRKWTTVPSGLCHAARLQGRQPCLRAGDGYRRTDTRLTVSRFENGAGALAETLQLMQEALERAGILFIPEDERAGPGVRIMGDKQGAWSASGGH